MIMIDGGQYNKNKMDNLIVSCLSAGTQMKRDENGDIRLSVASIGVMERIPHALEQEVP